MLRELEYPFESERLITSYKKFLRILKNDGTNRIQKKIAILGGSTIDAIRRMLELFLLNAGIEPEFYESEYNQYYQEAIFPNEKLAAFKPDIIYIHTTNRNIDTYPSLEDTPEKVSDLLREETKKFHLIWESLATKYHCPIIQNNFEMPFYRLLGNKDASDVHGKVNFLSRMNMEFYAYTQKHDNFYLCDINYLSADYGLKEWSNPMYYYLYKYSLNLSAVPYLAFNVANIIKSIFGKNKKGFVIDLDNTLWGGVVGEDGPEALNLGTEDAEGMAYLEFQKYLKQQKQLGVLLNINSKNDPENAALGLKHPDSVLSLDDFAVIRANWQAKDRNFSEIAQELNILPESLVFLDDNPAERHIVAESFPEVSVPPLGSVQQSIMMIDRAGYFETTVLSQDDQNRDRMYQENKRRQEFLGSFQNYQLYLESLQMTAQIKPFEPVYFSRIAQLTNKSNQFNLTTKRYTQAEIERMASDSRYLTFYGKLSDRFGENGVVSVMIGHIRGKECHIDLWLMSCRVLKRDMEYAMMDSFVECCRRKGISSIWGYYYPTSKNRMVQNLYEKMGFSKMEESVNGNSSWRFEISQEYIRKNHVIEVEGN